MATAADELRFHLRKLDSLVTFRAELEELMADVDQAVADLVSAVDGVAARVQEDVQALLDQIRDMESASAEDKAALTRAVEGIGGQVSRLQGIDPVMAEEPAPQPPEPDPIPPAPEPTPEPDPPVSPPPES